MPRSELLTAYESCHRKAAWLRSWEPHKLTATQMVTRAVTEALCSTEADIGEYAGETVMTLATDRGLDCADSTNVYRSVINHAAISDIVTVAIRKDKEPWIQNGGVLTDSTGNYLRRFIPVSTWNDDRARYEMRSWYGLGEVCQHKMPMQMVVAVLGTMNGGRRHGYWSKALLHPQRSSLRFRRRSRGTIEGFKETWIPCWREENAQIEREKWLQAMLDDAVLSDALFVVDIPVPGESEMQAIRDLAKRQLDKIAAIKELPDRQMSTCDGPLTSCPFRCCCWSQPELGPELGGFDRRS